MPIKSQIRLAQVTGSMTAIKPAAVAVGTPVASLTTANIPDAEAILDYFAQALTNIHGNVEFGANTPGTISFADGTNVDIVLEQKDTGQKIKLQNMGGVSADSLLISSSEGGIIIDAQKSGKAIELITDFLQLTSSNTGPHSMQLDSKGGIDIDAVNQVNLFSGQDSTWLTANAKTLTFGEGIGDLTKIELTHETGVPLNEKIILNNKAGTHASEAIGIFSQAGGVKLQGRALHLSGGVGTDVVGLSGSVVFSAEGHEYNLGGTFRGSGMLFAKYGNMPGGDEIAVFQGKTIFGKETTLVGALNQLADSVASSEPTLFTKRLTANINAGGNVVLTKIAGDAANLLKSVGDNKCQVFVNGQLLRSSSGGATNDYAITANNTVVFQFDLKVEDEVAAMDFS